MKTGAEKSSEYLEKAIRYFQAVADNAWEMESVCKRLDRDGFGILGGNQQLAMIWPNPKTAGAIEALDVLKQWKEGTKSVYLRADSLVAYGVVIEVMGRLKSMGIEDIGLITAKIEEGFGKKR